MADTADVTILVTAVDEELYTRLLVVANRMGVSVSDVAMLALANYLEEK
jgi:antitoxin component of RelBE/YafQ-DinJ toxin-antitoxin module